MSAGLQKTPFPITYRELWLPEAINGTKLPSSKNGGHALTLTGASKQTTSDGVHFTGAATSNIVVAANAAQNAKAAFNITIRFKLDATFATGAASDQYLFQKLLAADDYIKVFLENADGKLYWMQGNVAGGNEFTLTSTTVSWTAGTWYIITCSLTDGPVQRLLINGTLEDSDAVATPVTTPNGGDMIIGSSSDGGVDGLIGVISFVEIGVGATATVALVAADETDLAKGIPAATAKVQYLYLMDEGRLGATCTNRGDAGVAAGTLDSACTWAFGSCKRACLSLDGINDYAPSSLGVNITGDSSLVVVVKSKNTQDTSLRNSMMGWLYVNGNNYISLSHAVAFSGTRLSVNGSGVIKTIAYSTLPAIDDYRIYIATVRRASTVNLFVNGTLVTTGTWAGIIVGAATAYFGEYHTGAEFGNDEYLFATIIEGALSSKQVLEYSKWLNYKMRLGIAI